MRPETSMVNQKGLPLNLTLWPEFISKVKATYYINYLIQRPELAQGTIRLFGKTFKTPRLEALYGEKHLNYSYSNQQIQANPLCPILDQLKREVEHKTRHTFNCVFVNVYRNGLDSNGWHADNETELGRDPIIASLSLGASRKFLLKSNVGDERINLVLNHGDLLLMGSGIQNEWKHCVPKALKIMEPRVNLTFRKIIV